METISTTVVDKEAVMLRSFGPEAETVDSDVGIALTVTSV